MIQYPKAVIVFSVRQKRAGYTSTSIIYTGLVNQFTSRINNKLKLVWMKTQSNPERKQLRPKIEAKAAKDSNGISTKTGCLIVCLYMSHLSYSLGFWQTITLDKAATTKTAKSCADFYAHFFLQISTLCQNKNVKMHIHLNLQIHW